MSFVRFHTRTQTSLPLSNCSTGDVWSNLDHSPRITQRGGRRHRFTCGRRAPAACPRLHSPPAWDQGCLEAIAKVMWNPEYHDSSSRQSSHEHSERSMLTSESTSWNARQWKQWTFEDLLLNVNISLTVAQVFTKFGNFVEKVLIVMSLNCNCAKLDRWALLCTRCRKSLSHDRVTFTSERINDLKDAVRIEVDSNHGNCK